MITVSIVEDNPTTLSYLRALLHGTDGIEVIDVCDSGTEALNRIPHNVPDVLISDLNLPDISGISVIRELRDQCFAMEVLVLSMHEDRQHLFAAFKAGATGYILKGTSASDIIRAVRDVANGGAPISPRIARYLLSELGGRACTPHFVLSPREKEVLGELSHGLSEKKVAEKLNIKQSTVHTHVVNIYQKLRVKSRAEAVLKAKVKRIL